MHYGQDSRADDSAHDRSPRLSYKFQRLRERIRGDLLGGLFGDRLPGERELGRRYQANAKTVNKALSDLASEGLLIRRIGRGTFVANGAEETASRGHAVFGCFHVSNGSHDQLQARFVAGLKSAADAAGCRWRDFAVSHLPDSGRIPLSAWPGRERRAVNALFSIPIAPLGRARSRPSRDLVMEAYRRHVPIVLIGACPTDPKLNAVVPDYVDAGYRVTEHLCRLGCESIVAIHYESGREADFVLSGCRTAATRQGGEVIESKISPSGGPLPSKSFGDAVRESTAAHAGGSSAPAVGCVLIGADALEAFRTDSYLIRQWCQGQLAIACVPDAGDASAHDLGFTAYEIDAEPFAAWGVRLAAEAKPGQRPIEIVVPGTLRVRDSISPEARASRAAAQRLSPATPTPNIAEKMTS